MRQLSDNRQSGLKTFWDWDDDNQEHVFTTEIDRNFTKAVIDRNKQIEGQGMGSDLRLAASIPPEVQFEWLDKHKVEYWNPEHKDKVKALLNSNEYRYLRVNHFMM